MSKKKTAMQKGYRKQVKAKPFLTKKEIITLIAILAAILLAVVLFNVFYDDGYLGAKEVQSNDLVTYASADIRDRYMKLAEVGEKEGFTRTSTQMEGAPVGTFTFTPDAPQDNLDSFRVNGSFVSAQILTDSFQAYAEGSGVEVMEPVETTLCGLPAYVFAYEADYYSEANDPDAQAETEEAAAEDAEAETEEPAPNTFEQNISAYIAVDDTHTISLHAYRAGEDESFYMPHEEAVAYIEQFADVINVDFEEK